MRISLGTAQFGLDYGISNKSGKIEPKEVDKILSFAKKNGIKSIDTAQAYGESETVLGKYDIDDFEVISKLPPLEPNIDNTYDWTIKKFNDSLRRLRINCLYGYLIHNPNDLISNQGQNIFRALMKLKDQKLVKKIGVSCYDQNEVDEIISKFNLDIIQLPLKIIDRRFEKNGLLKKLKQSDIEIHTRSCFLQGLLLMKIEDVSQRFPHSSDIFKVWNEWLHQNDTSALEACLKYPLSIKYIDKVVVGIEKLDHLREILDFYIKKRSFSFPEIWSNDENLINPSKWKIS